MRGAALVVGTLLLAGAIGPPAYASRLKDRAIEVGPGITPPWTGGTIVLETPKGVSEQHSHATLTIRLLVDSSGRVRHTEARGAPDPRLARVASALFRFLKFHPATRDGKPVDVWWNRRVAFRPKSELDSVIPPLNCVPAVDHQPIREDMVTDDVELPRIVKIVFPDYPRAMLDRRMEGDASFRCVIDTCGRIRECIVVAASRPEFAKSGLDAVIQRRYTPALRNGVSVTITFVIDVTFRLR
jgi:TonB family C-terminal domain